MKTTPTLLLIAALSLTGSAVAQQAVNLTFGTPSRDGNVYSFTNVATGVNATVLINPLGLSDQSHYSYNPNTAVQGNYQTVERVDRDGNPVSQGGTRVSSQDGNFAFTYQWDRPSGYRSDHMDQGGYSLTFQLYDSEIGTGFDSIYTAEALRIFVYDVDGSNVSDNRFLQDEFARAYIDDGLVSYQVAPGVGGITVTEEEESRSILYTGSQTDRAESSTLGAFVLDYQNTDSFTIDLFAATPRNTNLDADPVFTAIAGKLPFDGTNGSPNWDDEFDDPITPQIPEPSVALLSVLGLIGLARRRR